jgi:hypothetical protein
MRLVLIYAWPRSSGDYGKQRLLAELIREEAHAAYSGRED